MTEAITKFNDVAPVALPAGRVTPFHVLAYSFVAVDEASETYNPGGPGKALLKSALNKMASAMGVRMVSSGPVGEMTEDRFMWQVATELPLTGRDPLRTIGTYEWVKDQQLRKCKTEEDRQRTIQFRVRMAESKAYNAALRDYGIKSSYSHAELSVPFRVPRLDYSPDLTDPAVVQIMATRQDGAAAALYGAPQQALEAAPEPTAADLAALNAIESEDAVEYEVVEEGENAGATVDTATGEVIADADDIPIEDEDAAQYAILAARRLQHNAVRADGKALVGMTFAEVLEFVHGTEWMDKAIAHLSAKQLNAKETDELEALAEFTALAKKVGS